LKLSILAVGDDDQNIYRFRGANVDFTRRFREDYDAAIHYLVENYRSPAHIIEAANQFIARNADRMKTDRPIVVNKARSALPKGGNWQHIDHLAAGRVQILSVAGEEEQAAAVLQELKRLQAVDARFSLANTAILVREWHELDPVRTCLEEEGIPVNLNWGKSALPSLTRIREYVAVLEYLRVNWEQNLRAGTLLQFLPQEQEGETIWQTHLRSLIDAWREETNDSLQPVPKVEEYLYESLADQHRARHLSNGVFLSTVHSVKGLEFDHVFVLGGCWRQKSGSELEDERRLFYVAMTRARETLQLLEIDTITNPHTARLVGDFALRRRVQASGGSCLSRKRYAILGMKALYLGYADRFFKDHPTHAALDSCRVGDQLNIAVRDEHIYLTGGQEQTVARLSQAARDAWLPKIDSIVEIRVLAMVRWGREDVAEKTYADQCKCEVWEIPVCEVVYR